MFFDESRNFKFHNFLFLTHNFIELLIFFEKYCDNKYILKVDILPKNRPIFGFIFTMVPEQK